MNFPRVMHYRLQWNVAERHGSIALVFTTNNQAAETSLVGLNAEEFHAISTMLREERPIYWDASTNLLFTGNEPVGEEEID